MHVRKRSMIFPMCTKPSSHVYRVTPSSATGVVTRELLPVPGNGAGQPAIIQLNKYVVILQLHTSKIRDALILA